MEIFITDEHKNLSYNYMRLYFIDAAIWATKNCLSFKNFMILDEGSDTYKQKASYVFDDPKDALLFQLKWC